MVNWTDINDDDFYNNINSRFEKYTVDKNKETMRQLCLPHTFKLQVQQKFLRDFINPDTPYKGILIYHKIGAGKTCTAVSIAEEWKHKRKIIVIVPASLIGNFRDELRSPCGGYLSIEEQNKLNKYSPLTDTYKNIIKKSDERINKYYTIMSYHKFVKHVENKTITFKNSLVIIDEIQNMISSSGKFYRLLYQTVSNAPENLRLVLLSATPMFDKPVEIALTLNLLRPKEQLPIGINFNEKYLKVTKINDVSKYSVKNMNHFKKSIQGLVSYYRGASPKSFPEEKFRIVRCKMEEFQYKSYLTSLSSVDNLVRGSFKDVDILNLPSDFFLGSRMISNIAYPNKGIGLDGYNSLKDKQMNIENLGKYSSKFSKILNKLKKCAGLSFVYSNFKEYGGLKPFIKILEYHGWKDYKQFGTGKKRFAVWTGDEPQNIKEEIKRVFNNHKNADGHLLKVMLGSPSIKEGVSLLRVQQVHIIEPYWNMSRMLQIIGRAVRFCSHKDMPAKERVVKIYLYLSITNKRNIQTVDQYIWELAKRKSKLIYHFEKALKESAVDCTLFKNANVHNTDENYKCEN
jgi:superfamily II DNA or RNA helicase